MVGGVSQGQLSPGHLLQPAKEEKAWRIAQGALVQPKNGHMLTPGAELQQDLGGCNGGRKCSPH